MTIADVSQLFFDVEQVVGAVSGRARPRGGQGSKYNGGQASGVSSGGKKAKSKGLLEPEISKMARLAAGLCLAH